MAALGVRLGPNRSLVAFVNDRRIPELAPDSQVEGEYGCRSIVHVAGNACVVGNKLEKIRVAARNLDIAVLARQGFGTESVVYTDESGRPWGAEGIAALILRKLRADARSRLNTESRAVTIAVPRAFSRYQRLCMRSAALMAGFEDVALVDEPIAAVAGYQLDAEPAGRTFLVLELGHDSCAAAVVESHSHASTILAGVESSEAGIEALSATMTDQLVGCYRRQFAGRMVSSATRDALGRLAIDIRNELCVEGRPRAMLAVACEGEVLEICYTREQLERDLDPVAARALSLVDGCLAKARVNWARIDTVVLAGDDPVLGMVLRILAAHSGIPPSRILHHHGLAAVAYGAAILADQRYEDGQRKQRARYSIGMRTFDPNEGEVVTESLVLRGIEVPAETSRRFLQPPPEDGFLHIELVLESDHGIQYERLAKLEVNSSQCSGTSVPVRFRLLRDGLLSIATESGQGQELLIDLEDSSGCDVFVNRQHSWVPQINDY